MVFVFCSVRETEAIVRDFSKNSDHFSLNPTKSCGAVRIAVSSVTVSPWRDGTLILSALTERAL